GRPVFQEKGVGKGLPGGAGARPALAECLVNNFRFKKHMPESFRPPQIDGQEETAENEEGKGDPVAHAGQFTITRSAGEVDQRGYKVGACGNAAKKEIENNPPAPV